MEAGGDNTDIMKALMLYTEADLSNNQYEKISRFNSGRQIFPSYSALENAMQVCYPPKEPYHITNTSCEVKLQNLLNHTVTRLLTHLKDTINLLNQEERETLELVCKWGCYGLYDDDTDSIIYQTSLVPVQLLGNCGSEKEEIWSNPKPSSTRYCRPIRFKIMYEQKEIISEEIDYIQKQIDSLHDCKFSKDGLTATVKVNMVLTKIDDQICNAAADTLSTKCNICGATSQEFNDLNVKTDADTADSTYAFSTRHASIRFFEGMLHLAYKLPVKTWITSAADEEIVANRKSAIREAFRREMDLIVNTRNNGFSNSSDDIRSGMFFSDPEKASEITGIDFNLIYRLKIILEVVYSGRIVDYETFNAYCLDTAKLYVSLYPWMPMTLTMHQILTHTELVMEKVILPFGKLSVQLVEALQSSEEVSREDCNLDVFNRLMLMSDPLITGQTPRRRRLSHSMSKEAVGMLLEDVVGLDSDESDDE